jgi:dTDP-4-dehydrorhamnose 3,5-epimerase
MLMSFEFSSAPITGPVIIMAKRFGDNRGFFMETYKESEFAAAGIDVRFTQDNHSMSSRGVLRGLHFQCGAHAQGKLIWVIAGRVWDVAVDIRPNSPDFLKYFGMELSADDGTMLYIPPGFAHGFVTLEDDTHFLYKCTKEYNRESEGGIRWNDPAIGIDWPRRDVIVSDKDTALPLSSEFDFGRI